VPVCCVAVTFDGTKVVQINPPRKMDSPSQSDELADLLLADLEEHAEHNTATNNEPQAQAPKESPESATALLFDAPQAEPAPKRQKLEASSRGGTCPPHPGFIGGICIRCGVDKPIAPHAFAKKPSSRNGTNSATNNATAIASATDAFAASPSPLALKYIHHGLEVSRGEAARLRQDTVQKALLSRRLLLVLDLDHTLLHSTRVIDVSPEDTDALTEQMKNQDPLDPTLYHIPYMGMWTKLRPGLRTFLSRVKEMYDLHVFTMGDKDYAAGMAALIDPDGRLFGGRVASSSDAGAGMVKDIDVLLGAEELVVILDDTAAVWPKHRHNLIQVDRYIYFPSCAAKFGSRYVGVSMI
jgi:RNA polymerase II C-terminal domain phosphatase-like 3/4